ncbi:hypothetical protein ISS07_04830, partial [Candidatus Woesearchaeota archaeon]|nr:hypothetical protein [Candidatus Woesearchaeota archaeon]
MKKRGQGGEAIKYLIISSMIIVISLFGYSVFDKIRDKTCNSELAKFEIDLRDLDKQVKFGSAEEFQRVVPCNADKIYFVDLDSDIDMELLDDEPLLRDSISSKAQKNVFLMKKGKILDSFYAGNLGLSYPNFMCLVPRTGKIDFFLEGKGRSVDMYAGCFQPECTFLPQKVTDEEAAAIVREANEFGCANCPNRGIYDEWAKYYDVKLNFDISRKYKYCAENGQTTVEVLIKPKDGADFENFHFYESIPKECIENINDYLVDEIDADIKPDPLIAWNLGG